MSSESFVLMQKSVSSKVFFLTFFWKLSPVFLSFFFLFSFFLTNRPTPVSLRSPAWLLNRPETNYFGHTPINFEKEALFCRKIAKFRQFADTIISFQVQPINKYETTLYQKKYIFVFCRYPLRKQGSNLLRLIILNFFSVLS